MTPTKSTHEDITASPRVLILSCYEMGRQPLGIASAAAVCQRLRLSTLCHDLSLGPLDTEALARFRASDGLAYIAFPPRLERDVAAHAGGTLEIVVRTPSMVLARLHPN